MKAAIFQGEGVGGVPTREELVGLWKQELDGVPELDEICFYDRMSNTDADAAFGDAEIVLGTFIPNDFFTPEFLDRHPRLRYVSSSSHGYGRIDFSLLRERNIFFTNTVYSQQTIAEFAFALLLDICHDVTLHSDYYKKKDFDGDPTARVAFVLTPQIELYGKTFGIYGLGHIGLCAARMAKGFGMNVIAYSRSPKSGPEYSFIRQVSREELFASSDVISIHCPLTEETRGAISREALARMKDGVIILNTARGEIIDEDALAEALHSGKVYAAGLDVLAGEPLKKPSVLMSAPRTKITPHMAWTPPESRRRGVIVEAENLKRWLRGEPVKNLAEK